MIDTCSASWILPFTTSDFPSLSDVQFSSEIEKAQTRAEYIILNVYKIPEDDYNADVSGQIQIGLELLTSAEFLKKYIGLVQRSNLLMDYSNPVTKEELEISPEQFDKWLSIEKFLRNQAWDTLFDYIDEDVQGGTANIGFSNYNWELINKDYEDKLNVYSDSSLYNI